MIAVRFRESDPADIVSRINLLSLRMQNETDPARLAELEAVHENMVLGIVTRRDFSRQPGGLMNSKPINAPPRALSPGEQSRKIEECLAQNSRVVDGREVSDCGPFKKVPTKEQYDDRTQDRCEKCGLRYTYSDRQKFKPRL